jgi:hypothetical protein
MTTTAEASSGSRRLPDDAPGVLAFARAQREVADRAEVHLLQAAVQWAVIHPAESIEDSESYTLRTGGEAPVGLAGPGAPLVAEFCVAELGAAVGLGPEAGKYYLGHALELRYRLPRLWEQVLTGTVQAWKARRVADATIGRGLSLEAAAFVDAHVAAVAGKVRPWQLERLVDEAVARFMPESAEAQRRKAADGRHFTIDTQQPSFAGTAYVSGELDLADALDLDDAIRGIAGELKDLGCSESLDVRRSMAAGELARRQRVLPLAEVSTGSTTGVTDRTSTTGGDDSASTAGVADRTSTAGVTDHPTTTGVTDHPTTSGRSRTVLHVHLTDAALRGEAGHGIGRCENTRTPVTVDTIRDWLGRPDAHVTVKPVIDVAEHVHVDAYEVPDRLKEQVALRDHACVFPWCTRPARACDCDHIRSWKSDGSGGDTCTCELAPLCRTHHRLKTHGSWTYTPLEPGTFLWTSPHGYQYLRDHTGTLDVSRDRPRP